MPSVNCKKSLGLKKKEKGQTVFWSPGLDPPPPPLEKNPGSAHAEVYATRHDPKIYPHTKFGILTSNYIQICSRLDLARTEIRGQGHSDLETVGDSSGPKMYLHTKYGTATINNK